MLAQGTGDLAEARHLYDQSLQLKRELGDKQGIAITLAQTALLEEQEGNLAQALSLIRQAEQLFTELDSLCASRRSDIGSDWRKRPQMSARVENNHGGHGEHGEEFKATPCPPWFPWFYLQPVVYRLSRR